MAVQFKVWVHIEQVDEADGLYEDIGEPELKGTFSSLAEAQDCMSNLEYQGPPYPVCLEHDGITIYHVHRNDDPNDVLLDYWFTLNEDGANQFDVRDLRASHGDTAVHAGDSEAINAALRRAIESGELRDAGSQAS